MNTKTCLYPDERLDDLQRNGYKIIQNPNKFCFGIDAVLLSGFADIKKGSRVLDLGTGTGILPILLAAKTEAKSFEGLEIQEESADMARRSVAYNGLQELIHITTGNIAEASSLFGCSSFDAVVTNPPYMNDKHGLKNPDMAKAIARHEILCSLEDVVRESSRVLQPKKSLFMVHRPFRLAEIFQTLQKHHMEPKRMRLIHPYLKKEPNMVLIEAVKDGNPMIKIEPPLIVYKSPGVYTKEILELYRF
ncbi:MAG: tRNA1(Val) (adenine(37)-N6)-methyltransferase [Lachnospiraceae bacterium]|nr:tRNA1(Val) (adenine(37)-N6)-methyltransferase [Lachnospiraceae bacterium]MCI8779661.1 tRNA1(Val) (adenine(37)-N6)-methyltransferase [Lachnospiraceae bacterium]